ncbi:unnamed protein product [Callosobruchus maculatus]|uniref:Uncharacterized protein n=1 Tax=Callosobruchus maculatus TaxID=64391 RepID=A0A653D724_CALMS|nr:unnamed protein product [Callosobruchus maculatus]
MYNTTSTFRKDAMWRKMTESVGSKKLRSVKSRYKTAAFRHRPPAEKAQDNMLRLPLSKCNIFPKKSSGILKKTPVMTPINEDNITTMVEMEQMRSSTDDNEFYFQQMSIHQQQPRQCGDQGQDVAAPRSQSQTKSQSQPQPHPQEDIVVQLLQLVLDINRRKAGGSGEGGAEGKEPGSGATTTAADKMAEVVEKLRKEGTVPEETLLRIAEELKANNQKGQGQDNQQQLELKLVTFKGDTCNSSERKKKKKKRKEARQPKFVDIQKTTYGLP